MSRAPIPKQLAAVVICLSVITNACGGELVGTDDGDAGSANDASLTDAPSDSDAARPHDTDAEQTTDAVADVSPDASDSTVDARDSAVCGGPSQPCVNR